jgi:nucleoside-diphosphate-sugar epimerase
LKKHVILLTGATGFVGRCLCAQLLAQGYSVRAVARHATTIQNVEVVSLGDIDSITDWSNSLKDIDSVIHLAARVHVMTEISADSLAEFRKVNVESTLRLATQAAEAGVKRFIFMSSIKVNGESSAVGKPFTEDDLPNPQDAYGISKLEAELSLLKIAEQTGMEVVIIRPPLVYGLNVKANFSSMLKAVKRGIPLPFGAIKNQRSFIYVENLVNFILTCIQHPLATDQIFLVSDGQDLSTTELLRESAFALGIKSRLLPVPQKLLEIIASVLGKRDVAQRLCGNLQVDITKARTLLGWIPPFSVSEGLKRTTANLRKIP